MAVQIKCVTVEWKAMGQHGEAYCVTFHVESDPYAFDVPIWAPKDTPEEDLIPKARALCMSLPVALLSKRQDGRDNLVGSAVLARWLGVTDKTVRELRPQSRDGERGPVDSRTGASNT